MSQANLSANPRCIHGKLPYEVCDPCAEDARAGRSNGFTRAPEAPSSKQEACEHSTAIDFHDGSGMRCSACDLLFQRADEPTVDPVAWVLGSSRITPANADTPRTPPDDRGWHPLYRHAPPPTDAAKCLHCGHDQFITEPRMSIVVPPPDVQRDAERWRALIGCARVRVLGSAGLKDPESEYAHIGLELWTRHAARSLPDAIETLTAFADRASATKSDLNEPAREGRDASQGTVADGPARLAPETGDGQ